MKHIRIQLLGDKSYLTYNRGIISVMTHVCMKGSFYRACLSVAYDRLGSLIQEERNRLKKNDKLADKESGFILKLLRNKRKRKANEAFNSKRPLNKHKHVGVEIEFISSSKHKDIAITLAEMNLTQFVHLKTDSSVHGDGDSTGECDGSCRENCECSYCGEGHFCDDEDNCNRTNRNINGHNAPSAWIYRDDCGECETGTETEEYIELVDDVETTLTREIEVNNCMGHCEGHSCQGYDDHNDYDCQCECDDSCGSNGESEGHEIAIVARSSQIANVVTGVCAALAKHDAKVNSSCGLHVHLDMRGFDARKCFSNLVKSQRLLYSMVPASRHGNSFCKPTPDRSLDSEWNGRYWGINPQSMREHETIEIRLHSGTLNSPKINHWITLLSKLAYVNKGIPEISKLSDLTAKINISPKLLAYISDRIALFAESHGSFSLPNDLIISEIPCYWAESQEYSNDSQLAA